MDLVFPPHCEVCDQSLHGVREGAERWLCWTCWDSLPVLAPPYCKVCGEAFDGQITDEFQCGNCRERTFHFEFAVAAFQAQGALRHLVHRFKYQRELHLRGLLGRLASQVFRDARLRDLNAAEWVLVPVPLHALRQWYRGFNQSWELCRELSRISGIKTVNGLKRVKFTKAQAKLTRRARLENLGSSFALRQMERWRGVLKGKKVLLVDDVLTTGSTTNECAKVLRREGEVEKVVVISLARS